MSCIATATLNLAIDANIANGVDLLAHLVLLGYNTTDAMLAARDAVHAGLVAG